MALIRRSFRSILLTLDIFAILATALILFGAYNAIQTKLQSDFSQRRSAEVAAIEQLFADRLTHYAESLAEFATVPLPSSAPFLDYFSDIYTITPAGTVSQILKALPHSAVFLGFQFQGEIGEFISEAYFSTVHRSTIVRAPENERPSIYFISPSSSGLVLARLDLATLRDDLARLVRYDGTIVVLVNREGIPLTNIGGELPTLIINQKDGEKISLTHKTFLVNRAFTPWMGVDIVLLTPTETLDRFYQQITSFFGATLVTFFLFLLFRLAFLNSMILYPMDSFITALSHWKAEAPPPEIPAMIRGVSEIEGTYQAFAERAESIQRAYLEIKEKETEILNLNKTLEAQVEERTQELTQALDKVVLSEKLALLGRTSAGIAHELNTPLAAIVSSAANLRESNETLKERMNSLLSCQDPRELELFRYLILKRSPTDITRKDIRALTDRLEQRGISSAREMCDNLRDIGVPLDDPELYDLLVSVPHAEETIKTAYSFSLLGKTATIVQTAAEKASLTIRAMRMWIYEDASDDKPISIRSELETILVLYYNQTKHTIQIIRDYRDDGIVRLNADRLNGVWVNLINNAIQAMPQGGELTVRVERIVEDRPYIRVSISDTGIGIPEENKPKIFTPFFTTKPKGVGSGIGLDLSKRIVEGFGGSISFESGNGLTTFTVQLPQ